MSDKELFEMRCAERDTFTKNLYPVTIDVIIERDGFTLQRATDNKTGKSNFKLFWDGECLSTMYNEKEAVSLFNDFAPAPRKKAGRPKKAA